LFASNRVITEAEAVLDLILVQFGAENISVEQLREKKLNERDPLKAFSLLQAELRYIECSFLKSRAQQYA
jgi:hypothetical protein